MSGLVFAMNSKCNNAGKVYNNISKIMEQLSGKQSLSQGVK